MTNMQHHGKSCDAVDAGLQVKRTARFGYPLRGGDKKLSLVLTFQKHQTVQPDVVDEYPVRHIATGIFFAKLNEARVIQSIHFEKCSHGFSGPNCQLRSMLVLARSLLFGSQNPY